MNRRNYNDRRLYLDTNILLDAIVKTRPQHAEAIQILMRCNGGGDMALTSASQLKDVYYILQTTYRHMDARECIRRLMRLVDIAPMGPEECILAIESNEPDFEDGLILACAELNSVDFILTRDEKAFKKGKIRVTDCAEYLEIAES